MSNIWMLRRFAQKLGPYLLLEMLLPGGTLLGLLLFVWRRGRLNGRFGAIVEFRPCQSTVRYPQRYP
jgi:hypothetical protein